MVFWDSQPVEASKEKGALPAIAALLQRTVSRVMAEQQSSSYGAGSAIRYEPGDAAASRP